MSRHIYYLLQMGYKFVGPGGPDCGYLQALSLSLTPLVKILACIPTLLGKPEWAWKQGSLHYIM